MLGVPGGLGGRVRYRRGGPRRELEGDNRRVKPWGDSEKGACKKSESAEEVSEGAGAMYREDIVQ